MGFVYVTRIDRQPGVVKIGKTTDLKQRLRSLNHTGVYGSHVYLYFCEVRDAHRLERLTHKALAHFREEGEFFRVSGARARRAIRNVAARSALALLREESHPELDREDAMMVRERIVSLYGELDSLRNRAASWNPFLRGRVVQANAREREIHREIAELELRLQELEPIEDD